MNAVEALEKAAQDWADLVAQCDAEAMDSPSGCGDWSNRELIDHVIGGGHRYAMLFAGSSAADTAVTRGNEYVADDAVAQFWRYESMMREEMNAADLDATVDHRAGPCPGHELLSMRVMELTLHAQDLSVGLGVPWEPSDAVVEFVLTDAAPAIERIRTFGAFGPALVPVSQRPGDRLLAFTGRRAGD